MRSLLRPKRPAEAKHVAIIVEDFKCAEPVTVIFQRPMHGNIFTDVLPIQRVGVGSVDVGVPAGPLVTRVIRNRVNVRGNCLETNHYRVSADKSPEIIPLPIATALVSDVKTELGAVEIQARLQIVHNKTRDDGV